MPDENELETATNLAVTLAWAAGAMVAAYLLGVVLTWVLGRIGRRSAMICDIAELTRMPVRATLMVVAATITVQRTSDPADNWRRLVDHTLVILLILGLTWLLTSLVRVAERRMISRFGGGGEEISDADRRWRRVRTQVTVLRRLATAVVVIFGGAAILMTFPAFSDIGTTVFASAGVLSVVAGLAAQTSLGAVFAGMQIAFSGAIRVGDVVQLENGQWWGRVEEITLSYVVVRLWDERRLVLPSTYFTTEPFENWTRSDTEIMGSVEFDVDFSVPFNDMRAELDRLLVPKRVMGRPPRRPSGDRCRRRRGSGPDRRQRPERRRAVRPAVRVREGMVDWVQHRQVLPTQRIEEATPSEPRKRSDDDGATPRVASGMFSGSPEAEERARAFDEHADYEDELARSTNGSG